MKVYLRTSITPLIEIYDTDKPDRDEGIVAKYLQPQLIITNANDEIIYTYGKEPKNYFPYLILIIASIIGLGLIK